jgi:hypothetical protein
MWLDNKDPMRRANWQPVGLPPRPKRRLKIFRK